MRTPLPFYLRLALAVYLLSITLNASAVEPAAVATHAWSFDDLDRLAQQCAERPFEPSPKPPQVLQDLNYDSYRLIAFEHERAIWKAERRPFWLECFHRGYLYNDEVQIDLVEDGAPQRLAFEPKLFQYRGELAGMEVPRDIGFAGFRVIGKFDSSPHPLELAALLGGCYFRAIGEGQVYGSSARALAIDIGLPKSEEFPVFRKFWIERPKDGAQALRMWALLDSPTVAGAYQMTMCPGEATKFDIRARLHFRKVPEKLGIAPLTSMWMWGDGRAAPAGERRPKVHDADGLLIHTADDEWIWRPLSQQGYPSLTHYDLQGNRGFGLLQRDRTPTHFLDDEAKYHQRPSIWIEPQSGWKSGAVELLELPAEHEGIDNIAAWWVPHEKVKVGEPLDLEYRVSFLAGDPSLHRQGVARAVATRVLRKKDLPVSLEVDFESEELAMLTTQPKPELKVQRGKAGEPRVEQQTDGKWRVSFDMHPEGDAPVELSLVLMQDKQPLTETWRYLCPKP